ncbi:hypothetical protein ACFWH7_19590 [Cellulosimicrobium cellulans]|uniref:hypothetical protein n=1 Tax=Cellulosimicrobium cellulans TaxID=1710 RepID=UPI00365184CF
MATTITDGTDVVTALRTNVIQDAAATFSAGWAAGGLGTPAPAAPETMVVGATDGPILPDGTMVTTYARYTLGGATGAGASPYFLTFNVAGGNYQGDFPAGLGVGTCIYLRTSVAGSWYCRRWSYLAGAAAGSQQADPVLVPANTWVRLDHFDRLSTAADYFRASANGPALASGQTVDVTAAMVTPDVDEVGPWFNGSSPVDPPLSYAYLGAPNASASVEVQTLPRQTTPDLVLTMEYSAEVRNIFHATLDRSDPDMTKRPTATRAGDLELFYSDLAAAQDAYAMLRDATTLTLTNDVDPWKSMTFAPSTRLALRREGESARWVVTVGYTEVAP